MWVMPIACKLLAPHESIEWVESDLRFCQETPRPAWCKLFWLHPSDIWCSGANYFGLAQMTFGALVLQPIWLLIQLSTVATPSDITRLNVHTACVHLLHIFPANTFTVVFSIFQSLTIYWPWNIILGLIGDPFWVISINQGSQRFHSMWWPRLRVHLAK